MADKKNIKSAVGSGALAVKEQPKMSLLRIFLITIASIRYRLFRSIVTLCVIIVAVAFLMNILTESIIKKSAVKKTAEILDDYRLAAKWASRLTIPDTLEKILNQLASAKETDAVYLEFFSMGRFSEKGMKEFQKESQKAAEYLKFFKNMDYSRKRRLIYHAEGIGIFDSLQKQKNMDHFIKGIKEMKFLRIPGSLRSFKDFLNQWNRIKNKALLIHQTQIKGIAEIKNKLKTGSILEALQNPTVEFGNIIREQGFLFDKKIQKKVALQAKQVMQMSYLEKSVISPEIRKEVAAYLNISPAQVSITTLWDLLKKKSTAAWYLEKMKKHKFHTDDISVKQMMKFARIKLKESTLNKIERVIGGDIGEGIMGMGERMSWLVLVSMVVCIVGISNAMLMSVTERFREIAVLKCLGALDGSIMLMFVLEASILGVFGGIVGSLLGFLIGFGRMAVSLGHIAISSLPLLRILSFIGVSTLLGIILAALASVYPSFKAARLAPMEAMRIE